MTRTTKPLVAQTLYEAYLKYQHKNGSLPLQLAAILTVSDAVAESEQPLTTLSESISLVASLSENLKTRLSFAEALAVSAGTDAFQRLLVTTLARPSSSGKADAGVAGSVADTKRAITEAATSYVDNTLTARNKVAAFGHRLVAPGTSIVVPSYSSIVDAFLRDAATSDVEFQVFFVSDPTANPDAKQQRLELIDHLSASEVGAIEIPLTSIAQLLQCNPPKLTATSQNFRTSQVMVLAGAAALLASGGALTSSATQTVASVAKAYDIRVLLAAESAKCVKELGQPGTAGFRPNGAAPSKGQDSELDPWKEGNFSLAAVPASFITTYVSETDPQNPSAVAEEALRMWS